MKKMYRLKLGTTHLRSEPSKINSRYTIRTVATRRRRARSCVRSAAAVRAAAFAAARAPSPLAAATVDMLYHLEIAACDTPTRVLREMRRRPLEQRRARRGIGQQSFDRVGQRRGIVLRHHHAARTDRVGQAAAARDDRHAAASE